MDNYCFYYTFDTGNNLCYLRDKIVENQWKENANAQSGPACRPVEGINFLKILKNCGKSQVLAE